MRTRRHDPISTPAPSSMLVGVAVALCVMGLPSCSGAPDGETVGGSTGGFSGSSSGGGGSGGSGAFGGGGSGGGLIIDAGSTGGSAGDDAGCQKVDFLFVVDNSVSMSGEQDQLVKAFPGFISAIKSTLSAGNDIHVMVTDTDEWGRCDTANPWKGMDPSSKTCDTYIKSHTFEECDRMLGAGVVHPAGKFASDELCAFPKGRRWLDGKDPSLAENFECAARVGVAGHPKERPMDSMLAALAPAINATAGCNDGFLRDDALLVITFISDDPNYVDSGAPQDWYDGVVAAKKGDPTAVVVVGFTPVGCGTKGTTNGEHWAKFVSMFPNAMQAEVCAGDYVATFSQAVDLIDDSCDQYVAPVK